MISEADEVDNRKRDILMEFVLLSKLPRAAVFAVVLLMVSQIETIRAHCEGAHGGLAKNSPFDLSKIHSIDLVSTPHVFDMSKQVSGEIPDFVFPFLTYVKIPDPLHEGRQEITVAATITVGKRETLFLLTDSGPKLVTERMGVRAAEDIMQRFRKSISESSQKHLSSQNNQHILTIPISISINSVFLDDMSLKHSIVMRPLNYNIRSDIGRIPEEDCITYPHPFVVSWDGVEKEIIFVFRSEHYSDYPVYPRETPDNSDCAKVPYSRFAGIDENNRFILTDKFIYTSYNHSIFIIPIVSLVAGGENRVNRVGVFDKFRAAIKGMLSREKSRSEFCRDKKAECFQALVDQALISLSNSK